MNPLQVPRLGPASGVPIDCKLALNHGLPQRTWAAMFLGQQKQLPNEAPQPTALARLSWHVGRHRERGYAFVSNLHSVARLLQDATLVEEILVSKLRVPCFSLLLDGFAAGSEQSLENPSGIGGLSSERVVFRDCGG